MEFQTFIRCLEEVIRETGDNIPDLKNLASIEKKVESGHWSSKALLNDIRRVKGSINGLFIKELNEAEEILKPYKKDMDSDRDDIRSQLKSQASEKLQQEIDRYGDEAINLILFHRTQEERESISEQLLEKIRVMHNKISEVEIEYDEIAESYCDGDEERLKELLRELCYKQLFLGVGLEPIQTAKSKMVFATESEDIEKNPVKILKQFVSLEKKDYKFLVFLKNISFEIDTIFETDGRVLKLISSGQWTIDEIEDYFEKSFDKSLIDHETTEDEIEDLLTDKNSILLRFSAYGLKQAKKKARKIVFDFFDSFSLLKFDQKVRNPELEDLKFVYTSEERQSISSVSELNSFAYKEEITSGELEEVTEKIFLNQEPSENLEERFTKSLHFFRRSFFASTDYEAAVYIITSFESLLCSSQFEGSKNRIVVENMEKLARVKASEISKTKEAISEFYEIRNEVVHSGKRVIISEHKMDIVHGVLHKLLSDFRVSLDKYELDNFDQYLEKAQEINRKNLSNDREKLTNVDLELGENYSCSAKFCNFDWDPQIKKMGSIVFQEDGDMIYGRFFGEEIPYLAPMVNSLGAFIILEFKNVTLKSRIISLKDRSLNCMDQDYFYEIPIHRSELIRSE